MLPRLSPAGPREWEHREGAGPRGGPSRQASLWVLPFGVRRALGPGAGSPPRPSSRAALEAAQATLQGPHGWDWGTGGNRRPQGCAVRAGISGPSPEPRVTCFCRWCLDMALSRPVTALDNERFTVQSVMLHYAMPVVLVREACCAGEGRGQRGGLRAGSGERGSGDGGPRLSQPVLGVSGQRAGSLRAWVLLWGTGVAAVPLPLPTGQLPRHQWPALHAECPRRHLLAVHSPPATGNDPPLSVVLSSSPRAWVPSSLTAPLSLQPGGAPGFSLRTLDSLAPSCPQQLSLATQGMTPGQGKPCPLLWGQRLWGAVTVAPSLSGERCPAHPPPDLPSPLGSGDRLRRGPCAGPDEQGLPQLPGRSPR